MGLHIAIIGAGPAGYPAALTAARLGAQVTLIEQGQLGGVCLHCGCIPSKSLLDAAHRFDVLNELARFCPDEVSLPIAPASWSKIQARQQTVTQKLTAGIAALLRQAKVTLLNGTAEFASEHTLTVHAEQGDQTIVFDYAIIATGSKAFVPPPFDQLKDLVYDNSNIFKLPALPKTLAIIGGGAIGCEFATLMSGLGVQVQLIEMQSRLLPNMDENLARILTKNLQKRGVQLLLGQQVVSARAEDNQAVLQLDNDKTITAEKVLVAIGRTCDLTALHPERAGLSWTRKGLQHVNAQTLQVKDHIYAAGDVTGLSLLAHAGSRQGIVAAQNIYGQNTIYHNELIPNAVYTTPELASIGLNKAQAQAKGLTIKAHKSYLLANGRAQTMDQTEGFVEILSDADTGKILGASLAAPNASELISILAVALQAGMTVEQLKQVVFPHPTLSEMIGEALSK